MLHRLHEYLATVDWAEGDTPPLVDFHLYFEGNDEEECIAPNQWGDGRPPIAALYEKFKEIAARPDVERVLVGLHYDWNDPDYADLFPPAENVHILTSASQDEVETWTAGLKADGAIKGWPYGKPRNAPDPSPGFTVFSICWD
jgi:hypothetical protein